MANPTLAREDCAATNCTGLSYCISWHMQQFSSVFVQRFIGRQALGIADLMRVIAALGTHGKDRTSRPIYQTEDGLHMYTMYSNTTAKEGGKGSMAVEDSVLQRTPRRGNEQLNFFQPVEGKVWHWCGQSTGDERLARAAVESGSRRRPPCGGLRKGYQWATTNTQLEESRSSRLGTTIRRRGGQRFWVSEP